MAHRGKKYKKAMQETGDRHVPVSVKEALERVVKTAYAKFDETVGIDIVLGIDPAKGEQVVRGAALLPHGSGRTVRVLAFVGAEKEAEAKAAGADLVGSDDLIEKINAGWTDFDIAVATPDMTAIIGKVAKILGPKGLLPNKKTGTVGENIGSIIQEIKKGRVSFRNDKGGNLHALFGKVSFGVVKLQENLESLLAAIRASKPASSKGKFFKKMVVSSTMGVGFVVKSE
jgi:large subunit ribosomal protein L1